MTQERRFYAAATIRGNRKDSMQYVIALDQGTTSSRAIVFDREGGIRGVAQREFRQVFPQPGWVEHDATEIWASQSGVLHEALAMAGAGAHDIAAIGITNQRETTVIWDRATGRPIANAIVWQDRRTAPLCDELRAAGHAPLFARKTGLVLDAYFSGTKLRWLLDNVDGARARAERGELAFGTIDTWLIWNLTGGRVHCTDPSNASRTLLFDIHAGQWDDELLALLGVPRAVLPLVVPSSGVCANASIDGVDIPIAGIAGDQQAALFGQACIAPGMAKNTYGTGCFLLLNTGKAAVTSRNNLLTTIAWQRGGVTDYALEGSVFIGGAVVQWLRDGLKIIRTAADVDVLARSVPDNGGVYLVPAFAGLGAPHWDAYARGAIFGLTRGASGGHIARAALEAIAFQSADVLAAMEKDAGITLTELRVDGGATANDLLLQFQADILGVPVVRSRVRETTALGAAYLAGLAVGYWKSDADITSHWQADRRFEPAMPRARAATLRAEWERAVSRAMAWVQT
jgi:glycerol kinase